MKEQGNPILSQIVADALKAQGYDGLFNPDSGCACEFDDFMPCAEPSPECEAGYRGPCPDNCGEHDFHIFIEKQEAGRGD